MRIGIIIGSIRDGRAGQAVAEWVLEHASRRDDADFELVDLKTFDLPLLTSATVPGAAKKQYDDPRVTAWSQAIDALDAFVFVTPEYNHSVPAALRTPSTPSATSGATSRSVSSRMARRAVCEPWSIGARSSRTSGCSGFASRTRALA